VKTLIYVDNSLNWFGARKTATRFSKARRFASELNASEKRKKRKGYIVRLRLSLTHLQETV